MDRRELAGVRQRCFHSFSGKVFKTNIDRQIESSLRSMPRRQRRQKQAQATTSAGADDTVSAARELCRAGGALVAAARDEGTAAELAAMFAALQAAAAGRLARLQGEARLRARFEEQGLYRGWTSGGASMLTWGLQTLPEDLWARGVVCPAERAVMLGATSKRVRALLAGMQRRVPAAVRVVESASMDAVAGGLGGLQGWCRVVKLDLQRGWRHRIGAEGADRLAGVLGQCSSLAELNLAGNGIGAEGAGRLAEVLGQCSSLAVLNLTHNNIGAEGAERLAGVLGQCSSLAALDLADLHGMA